MTTYSNAVRLTRYVAATIGIFFGISSLGGLTLGLSVPDGLFLALGCLSAGITTSSYVWWHFAKVERHVLGSNLLLLFSFALTSGAAVDASVSWALWRIGYSMALGPVRDGHMAEVYWIGPGLALMALVSWTMLKRFSED